MKQPQPTELLGLQADRLPLRGLLALSAAAFLTFVLETIPAGILPETSSGMDVSALSSQDGAQKVNTFDVKGGKVLASYRKTT